MKNYLTAVEQVLKNEGGFVNHPADRGGATNWGITQKVYEAYKGRKVTVDEMRAMPRADAIAIYKKEYWDKIGGDQIKFYSTAFILFDQAVNRGVSAVVRQAQSLVGLPQDGVMGPRTIASINAMNDSTFVSQFLKLAEESYRRIVANNSSQSVFLNGWLNRITKIRNEASKFFGQLNGKEVGIGIGVIIALAIGAYFLIASKNKK